MLRVVAPQGVLLTRELDVPRPSFAYYHQSPPSSQHNPSSSMVLVRLPLGSLVQADGWASAVPGGHRRYRAAHGWVSARAAGDRAVASAAMGSGLLLGAASGGGSVDALCEVVDGEGSQALAQAKRALLATREAMSVPLLTMASPLLALCRTAADPGLRPLAAETLRCLLTGLAGEGDGTLAPVLGENPRLVAGVAALLSRLLPSSSSSSSTTAGALLTTHQPAQQQLAVLSVGICTG